jgi:hypothetical protein
MTLVLEVTKDPRESTVPPEIDLSRPVPPVEQTWDYPAEAVTT